MKKAIKLIFQELKDGDLTLNKAEKHLLSFYDDNVEKYVSLGNREIYIGEELGFPKMESNN